MTTSKLASMSIVGLSLLLSGCSLSNTTSVQLGTPTPAMMIKETPSPSVAATPMMLKPEEITGATRINGKVVLIGKDGKYQILTEQQATVGGARVMTDGKVLGRDGSSKTLDEGMAIDTQGVIKAATTKTVIDAKRQLMMPQTTDAMNVNPQPGAYQDYAPAKLASAKTGKVVLFFKASWCPTCKAVDADITQNLDQIPGNIRILKVDYDNSTELKAKYGVTYQHTFVQVDADGKLLKKWSGSPTLNNLLGEVI